MRLCENGWKYAIDTFNSFRLNWCIFTFKTFKPGRKEWGLKYCNNFCAVDVYVDDVQTIKNKIKNLKFEKNNMFNLLFGYK